jgi:hypothetical protein
MTHHFREEGKCAIDENIPLPFMELEDSIPFPQELANGKLS